METDAAVSELVGTILLISLVVIAASIVAVAILSQPIPEDVPQLTAIAENQSQTVYLLHTGGDSLKENEIKTIVNGQNSPFSLEEDENWPWSAGKLLRVDYPGPGMPEYVQLIYTGGSTQTLILTTYFVPADVFGAPPTIPPTLPTSIPTTIVTTLPTTIPTPDNGGCSDIIANFNANPITGDIPLLVTFTDTSSSFDPITNRTWNFGDGNVTITSNPTISHAYTSVGSYTVTLFVANVCGNSNSTTIPNLIVTSCPPVTANFTGSPTSGEIPLTVLFTDTSVSGVPITSRTWNFGDGNITTTNSTTISHTYTSVGSYTVTLTVTNACGNSNSTTIPNFIVTYCPPVTASFTGSPTSGDIPLTVLFTDTSTSGVAITSRTWNFGDGNVTTTSNPTISHIYTTVGSFTVTLTATNGCGQTGTKSTPAFIVTSLACGTITGTKYNDLNANGQRDPGEPGLPGWTIEVYRKQGNNWIFVKNTTTTSDGTYILAGLQYQPAQQYLVKEIIQPGWVRSQPVNADYYNFIVLNPAQCSKTDIDFGNYLPPLRTTLMNTNRGGSIKGGGQVSFTIEEGSSSSNIQIGGMLYNFAVGDAVSLTVNGDSTNVEIDMNGNRISRFSFPDVSVHRNGAFMARGQVTDIWISEYSNIASSLSIVVPSMSPVWTRFVFDGNTLIDGQNGQRIELFNLYPKASNGFMRLEVTSSKTYYDGAATSYQLT